MQILRVEQKIAPDEKHAKNKEVSSLFSSPNINSYILIRALILVGGPVANKLTNQYAVEKLLIPTLEKTSCHFYIQ